MVWVHKWTQVNRRGRTFVGTDSKKMNFE
jgi:hypothetical protein